MSSFFDKTYQTPTWLDKKLSRRKLLKSAAGATAIVSATSMAIMPSSKDKDKYQAALRKLEWQTLNAVFDHVLPKSPSGPSAQDIQATFYLYQLVHEQPTAQDEIDFIYRGIGWLNSYTQNKHQANFIDLSLDKKEQMLREISRSQAGENWINMMIINLYEAMLSPPSYGGNPRGIGWKWLEHQAGFPLPKEGKRYFELPTRSTALKDKVALIESTDLLAKNPKKIVQGRTKS